MIFGLPNSSRAAALILAGVLSACVPSASPERRDEREDTQARDAGAPGDAAVRDGASSIADAGHERDAALDEPEDGGDGGTRAEDAGSAVDANTARDAAVGVDAAGAECGVCPAESVPCERVTCVAGRCVSAWIPYGELAPNAQVAGDCLVHVCDGKGNVIGIPANEPPPAKSTCHVALCSAGTPEQRDSEDGRWCPTGVCFAGACIASFCESGQRDFGESDVDCGGSCPGCADTRGCGSDSDCASDTCIAGSCRPPACDDARKNGDESAIDCGGSCDPCAPGLGCGSPEDCDSLVCTNAMCAKATCADGVQNGSELSLDCGGGCRGCAPGAPCNAPSDCASLSCGSRTCLAASCSDGIKNGAESDTDCGGGCKRCEVGDACAKDGDCRTDACNASVCRVPHCFDGFKNGRETDIDCGNECGGCDPGAACEDARDCAGLLACRAGQCAAQPGKTAFAVDLPVRRIITSPAPDGTLYVTAGAAEVYPHQLLAFAPGQTAPAWQLPIPGRTGPLAVSDDGQTLYVGLYAPTPGIVRIDLVTRQVGAPFAIGSDEQFGEVIPEKLEVMPGQPDTVAVAGGFWNSTAYAGLHLYKNGELMFPTGDIEQWQSNTRYPSLRLSDFVFASADRIYGYNGDTSSYEFARVDMDDTGLFASDVDRQILFDYDLDLVLAGNKVFVSSGQVLDPEGPRPLGKLGDRGAMAVSPDGSRVYFSRRRDVSQPIYVTCFDAARFTFTGSFAVDPQVTPSNKALGVTQLAMWGDSGMALHTQGTADGDLTLLPDVLSLVPGCEPFATLPPPATALSAPDAVAAAGALQTFYVAASAGEYDPANQLLYVSLGSGDPRFPNRVAALRSDGGGVAWSTAVGSEPGALALSDDASTLWVGLQGAPQVVAVDVTSQAASAPMALEQSTRSGFIYPLDLQVLPGTTGALAVAGDYQGTTGIPPLNVYDWGVARYPHTNAPPQELIGLGVERVQIDSAQRVYGSTQHELSLITLGDRAMRSEWQSSNLVAGTFSLADGKLFGPSGAVVRDEPLTLLGTVPARATLAAPNGRHSYDLQPVHANTPAGFTRYELRCFDTRTFAQSGAMLVDVPDPLGAGASNRRSMGFMGDAGMFFLLDQMVVLAPRLLAGVAGCAPDAPPPTVKQTPTRPDASVAGAMLYATKARSMLRQRTDGSLFVSVASHDKRHPNEVLMFAPEAPQVSAAIRAGSSPGPLALSDDGSTLYAGLDGAGAVVPIDVATRTARAPFTLGLDRYAGAIVASDLAVMPTRPDVVALMTSHVYDTGTQGLWVFEAGVPMFSPAAQPLPQSPGQVTFIDTDTLWTDGQDLTHLRLTASGPAQMTPAIPSGRYDDLTYLGGKLFGAGRVLDVNTGAVLIQLPVSAFFTVNDDGTRMIAASRGERSGLVSVRCFDSITSAETASLMLEAPSGVDLGFGQVYEVDLWGPTGIAIRFETGAILLSPSALALSDC